MTREEKPSPRDCAIGHCKGKTMDHAWLFRDNRDFMKQIGLAQ